MSAPLDLVPTTPERIRQDLAGLKMPRALEALDATVRSLEQSEISALQAIDTLLSEELSLRENSRIKAGAWLSTLREARSWSQREFADRMGTVYHTFIS